MTLSAEDSPVSLSALQGKEKERMMTATSGRKCCELFAKYSPLGSLVRTLLESSRWYSPAKTLRWEASRLFSERLTEKEQCYASSLSSKPCVETLNVKDIASSRLLFRLVPSERHTDGTGFGLLPTVQTQGMKVCNKNGKTEFIKTDLLPTPMGTEVRHERRVKELKEAGGDTFHSRKNGETRPNGIMDYLDFHGLLITPSATDGMRAGFTMESLKNHKKKNAEKSNLSEQIAHKIGGGNSQLSPLFVEEMMGFPSMWTILPFLSQNGDKSL